MSITRSASRPLKKRRPKVGRGTLTDITLRPSPTKKRNRKKEKEKGKRKLRKKK